MQMESLKSKAYGDRLEGKVVPYFGILVADKMECGSQKIALGDVIFCSGGSAGILLACIQDGNMLKAVVDSLARECSVSTYGHRFRLAGEVSIWPAGTIECSAAWHVDPDGTYVVLRM